MNSKVKLTLIVLGTVTILTLIFWVIWSNTSDKRTEREATENLESLIDAQEQGGLSGNGQTIKENLISPFGGEAGTLLITPTMEIGYLPAPDERIMVFILSESVEQVESEAIDWLLSRGFSREDLCHLPVVFSVDNPEAQPEEEYKLFTNYLPPYCLE